jgi:hypothetical protein
MIFVQFATMGINIISVIVFIVLPHLVVRGKVLLVMQILIAWGNTPHRITGWCWHFGSMS